MFHYAAQRDATTRQLLLRVAYEAHAVCAAVWQRMFYGECIKGGMRVRRKVNVTVNRTAQRGAAQRREYAEQALKVFKRYQT